jgi:hypothetical protein
MDVNIFVLVPAVTHKSGDRFVRTRLRTQTAFQLALTGARR